MISLMILTMRTRSQNPTSESNYGANTVNPSSSGSQVMQLFSHFMHNIGSTGMQASGDSSMESSDWRDQLQADSRQWIVKNIMDTLKRHLSFDGHEMLHEFEKIAVRFEEKIYVAATSQADYIEKIFLKSNSDANSVNPSNPGNTMVPNNFANQRQIPGRQQQLAPQQQQQQVQQQQPTQNSHYLYQQQLHQMAKQKLQVQQGNIAPSMQQIQQQNLLQPSVMQSTMMQSVQNQQSVFPQSSQPLMNHQQSALRQQRQQQVQVQPTQQQVQVQVQQTQSNPMGQHPNTTNMQQQQRMLGQQNKPQQHLIGQHNNLFGSQVVQQVDIQGQPIPICVPSNHPQNQQGQQLLLQSTHNNIVSTINDSSIESGDWRAQLQEDSRQRNVNEIMDALKRHLPLSGDEGIEELKKIAMKVEEKIYVVATSQSDYLRKISLKMLTMDIRSQNDMQSN